MAISMLTLFRLSCMYICIAITSSAVTRDAGILYELWHTPAAHLAHRVAAATGKTPLTTETVIRSDGKFTLNEAFEGPTPEVPAGFTPDIYNVQPQLGFYCLYRPRPGENVTKDTPVCPNITRVAQQHAEWLTTAGFDYVVTDITNWPLTGVIGGDTTKPSTDMTILRPLQVLADEWLALRAKGIKTPSIAVWPDALCGKEVCMGGPEAGPNYAMWRWLLDNFYNDPKYSQIVYRRPGDTRKLFFFPSPLVPAYNNASFVAEVESNGGRNDVSVQSMWAMSNDFAAGAWGFFSSCTVPCPPPPPPPNTKLRCPAGQKLDLVEDDGDNGSCDCDAFCGADWTGVVRNARPHWTGAASAVAGATTHCVCVQANHFCPKNKSACAASCEAVGMPVPQNYCVPDASPPANGCTQVTTSMVDVPDCNQPASVEQGTLSANFEISASGSYMSAQCALPFAAPGHLRGMTIQRLFKKVLETGAPHLFMSSFNEFIGGRQASAYPGNTAINMGLPYDPQNRTVWVDSYGSEFSRDMEPTVEGGDRVWKTATSCVQLYKAGLKCSDSSAMGTLCCNTSATNVFANVWSFKSGDGSDSMLTQNQSETTTLESEGWVQQCNTVPGSTVFCSNPQLLDGREGPFMLYSVAVDDNPTRPLYQCVSNTSPTTGKHFISAQNDCEGVGKMDRVLGYIAVSRGGEMLRALYRCRGGQGRRMHSLDLHCDVADVVAPLGFVR